jgi:formylglycine-generating enzyme required for sulfatase activity
MYDGGKTFDVPAETFEGDIGPGITNGKGKHIVWDAGADAPHTLGSNYIAKIIADDGIPDESTPSKIREKDGMRMRLIPAGEFQMGSNDGDNDEKPVHTVYLDAYYIDETEITNEQYCTFLNNYGKNADAAGHELLQIDWSSIEKVGNTYKPKSGYEKHPIINVSWYGAAAYAQWLGARLPTEAEWEKAARGGLVGKEYPWGDDITHDDANYDGIGGKDKWDGTSPVGSFAPNDYGLLDMAGNVWEWCADEYDSGYYSKSPKNNPKGPGVVVTFGNNNFTNVTTPRVLRGGVCYCRPDELRCAIRYSNGPTLTSNRPFGFRCSQEP